MMLDDGVYEIAVILLLALSRPLCFVLLSVTGCLSVESPILAFFLLAVCK